LFVEHAFAHQDDVQNLATSKGYIKKYRITQSKSQQDSPIPILVQRREMMKMLHVILLYQ
jgi:hypothetical protein